VLWIQTMRTLSVKSVRKVLGLSQREMADLMAVSTKAIQSYEQGWRNVPPHIEQMLILQMMLHRGPDLTKERPCWQVKDCPPEVCAPCPARQTRAAGYCWLVTGTMCGGQRMKNWASKRNRCLKCPVLQRLLGEDVAEESTPSQTKGA